MSKQQLDQLRETLDTIVHDLSIREQLAEEAVQQELQLITRFEQYADNLTDRLLQQLSDNLEQSIDAKFEAKLTHLVDSLANQFDGSLERKIRTAISSMPIPPTLEEIAEKFEGRESYLLDRVSDRLTNSLQTAISIQLSPLCDELPDRLMAAVTQNLPSTNPIPVATELAMSELAVSRLARELEKFESKSMANMAARMTAGLQSAIALELSPLPDQLSRKLLATLHADNPSAAAYPLAVSMPMQEPLGIHRRAAIGDESEEECANTWTVAEVEANESERRALADEVERLTIALVETEALLVEALEQEPASASGNIQPSEQAKLTDLQNQLTRSEQTVELLRSELETVRASIALPPNASENSKQRVKDQQLREELEMASCQIIDLRSQNEELVEKVARLQVSTAPHGPMPHLGQEGMSWEERKRLLILQLNAELDDDAQADAPAADKKRLEVEDILKATQAELDRRDREIAELRSLVQQQSHAHGGMAVGAAAVFQMVESDELVQQEREKLRTIQQQWEDKFRQTEIELSMERARLARDRTDIDALKLRMEQEATLTAAEITAEANKLDKSSGGNNRKWLSRLGLKEEGR